MKKWNCKKAKSAKDLVCKELAEHLTDVIMAPLLPSVTVQEVLFQELLKRKPEYMKWKKFAMQMLPHWFSAKPFVLSNDEIKHHVEQRTKYDLDSAIRYFEVNVLRRIIAMHVNPWRQTRRFLMSRPGCKISALNFRELTFDRKFFSDVIDDEVPVIYASPKSKEVESYAKEHRVLEKKFPEDAYCSWSTKTAELMFWAIMTQDSLKDLRKDAMPLRSDDKRASYGSMNEKATAKNWPNDIEKMRWSKLVLKAGLLGHDEKWLHAQFAMWIENELMSNELSKREHDWDFKFMTRSDDFNIENMRMF